jgi:hypothetical protein
MKRLPVQQPKIFKSLKQSTIDQNALTIMLDQVLRPGDSAGSTQKG